MRRARIRHRRSRPRGLAALLAIATAALVPAAAAVGAAQGPDSVEERGHSATGFSTTETGTDPDLLQPGDPMVVYGEVDRDVLRYDDWLLHDFWGTPTNPDDDIWTGNSRGDCPLSAPLGDGLALWVMCDPTHEKPPADDPVAQSRHDLSVSNAATVAAAYRPGPLAWPNQPFVPIRSGTANVCTGGAGPRTWILGLTSWHDAALDRYRVLAYFQDRCVAAGQLAGTLVGDGVAIYTYDPASTELPQAQRLYDDGSAWTTDPGAGANTPVSVWCSWDPNAGTEGLSTCTDPVTSADSLLFGRSPLVLADDTSSSGLRTYTYRCAGGFGDGRCDVARIAHPADGSGDQAVLERLSNLDPSPANQYEYHKCSSGTPSWVSAFTSDPTFKYLAYDVREGSLCGSVAQWLYYQGNVVADPFLRTTPGGPDTLVRSSFATRRAVPDDDTSPVSLELGTAPDPRGPWLRARAAGSTEPFAFGMAECGRGTRELPSGSPEVDLLDPGDAQCYAGHVQPNATSSYRLDVAYHRKVWVEGLTKPVECLSGTPDGPGLGCWSYFSTRDVTLAVCLPGGTSFTDLAGTLYEAFVDDVADRCLVSGYPDGTFRATQTMTRAQAAAMLYKLAGEPPFTPPVTASFSDVPTTHVFFRDVEWLVAEGLTSGYPDGTFGPSRTMTRAFAVTFLYRLAGSPAFAPPGGQSFADVPPTHTFFDEVEWASSALALTPPLTSGCTGSTFCPNNLVTRGQFAVFECRWLANLSDWTGHDEVPQRFCAAQHG